MPVPATIPAGAAAAGAATEQAGLRAAVRAALADLAELPPYEEAPELYSDWGDDGEFKVWKGRGECAS